MAMIFVLQIALFSFAAAQPLQQFPQVDLSEWWFRVTPVRTVSQLPSTTCLLESQPIVQRDDYTYTPGIGGHKFHTVATTWPEARRICEEEGGHLAIVNSPAESKAIVDLWKKAGPITGETSTKGEAAIGFHDLFQEGEYITIHGETLAKAGFSDWAPGEPNNWNGIESCGSIHEGGGLNDASCSNKYAFVCEIPFHQSSGNDQFPPPEFN